MNFEMLKYLRNSKCPRGSFLGNQNQMSFIFVSVLVNKLEYTFERTNGKREVRTLIEPEIFKNFKVRADGFFGLGDRILVVSFEKYPIMSNTNCPIIEIINGLFQPGFSERGHGPAIGPKFSKITLA